MPWLPFYAAKDDLALVNEVLASDGDLAVLRPEGGGRWRAVLGHRLAEDGRYPLWHVPSGPLPLVPDGPGDAVGEILDPFAGWTPLRITEGRPAFGNTPGLLHLNLKVGPTKPGSSLGLSSIEWIGNYFWALGRVAPDVTKKRWDKLRRQFSKLGPKVTRGALGGTGKSEVFALPAALALLESGARADTFTV